MWRQKLMFFGYTFVNIIVVIESQSTTKTNTPITTPNATTSPFARFTSRPTASISTRRRITHTQTARTTPPWTTPPAGITPRRTYWTISFFTFHTFPTPQYSTYWSSTEQTTQVNLIWTYIGIAAGVIGGIIVLAIICCAMIICCLSSSGSSYSTGATVSRGTRENPLYNYSYA